MLRAGTGRAAQAWLSDPLSAAQGTTPPSNPACHLSSTGTPTSVIKQPVFEPGQEGMTDTHAKQPGTLTKLQCHDERLCSAVSLSKQAEDVPDIHAGQLCVPTKQKRNAQSTSQLGLSGTGSGGPLNGARAVAAAQ